MIYHTLLNILYLRLSFRYSTLGLLDRIKDNFEERRERKRQEDEKWKEYEDKVNELLDKFEIPDLDKFLMRYLNDKPEPEEDEDEETGRIRKIRPGRREYLDFVFEHLKNDDINFDHLKDFALKNRIVTPSFFGNESDSQYEKSDFETIISTIKANFEPEMITNEEHLEAQMMVFLKAKFPDRKIRRQVSIKGNDILDILIDDIYAFELKVPRTRTDLRDLGAQLEEYQEMYPNICAVIFDNQDANISQDIVDYIDKYRRSHGIQSIILGGFKRG